MLETSVTTESSKIVVRTDTSGFANSESIDSVSEIRMTAENVDVYYTDTHAIKNVNISIRANQVLAIIGPSGCGKSTFLRCLNRINDIIDGCRITGTIKLDGKDIYSRRHGCGGVASEGRDGISEAKSLSQVDL